MGENGVLNQWPRHTFSLREDFNFKQPLDFWSPSSSDGPPDEPPGLPRENLLKKKKKKGENRVSARDKDRES